MLISNTLLHKLGKEKRWLHWTPCLSFPHTKDRFLQCTLNQIESASCFFRLVALLPSGLLVMCSMVLTVAKETCLPTAKIPKPASAFPSRHFTRKRIATVLYVLHGSSSIRTASTFSNCSGDAVRSLVWEKRLSPAVASVIR